MTISDTSSGLDTPYPSTNEENVTPSTTNTTNKSPSTTEETPTFTPGYVHALRFCITSFQMFCSTVVTILKADKINIGRGIFLGMNSQGATTHVHTHTCTHTHMHTHTHAHTHTHTHTQTHTHTHTNTHINKKTHIIELMYPHTQITESFEQFGKVLFQSAKKLTEEVNLPSVTDRGAEVFSDLKVKYKYKYNNSNIYNREETSFYGKFLGFLQ